MTKDEALKLALEALEELNKLSIGEHAICLPAEIDTAIDAIREALAQPEQDYLAGVPPMLPQMRDGETIVVTEYAQPEPVIDKSAATRIATALGWEPKRTWVGLTDEEWEMTHWSPDFRAGAKWAEAKLKEKNT